MQAEGYMLSTVLNYGLFKYVTHKKEIQLSMSVIAVNIAFMHVQ